MQEDRDMLKRITRKWRKKNRDEEQVKARKKSTLRESVDSHLEAITYAEAGEHALARETLAQLEAQRRKILVVGGEGRFSQPVIEYAVSFAERMGYEIVALNVLPVPAKSPKLAPYCDDLAKEFEVACRESEGQFAQICREKNIPFTHVVRAGDVEECIEEIHSEFRRIEFVISEPDLDPNAVPEGENVVVPVYALAH